MEKLYILTTKYSMVERKTKAGTVYDVIFRVIDATGTERKKRLCGYSAKRLAKAAHDKFITENCEVVQKSLIRKKPDTKRVPLVGELIQQYLISISNQNRESSIFDKRSAYKIYVLPRFENTPIDKLTKEKVRMWQDDLWSTRNPETGEYYSYAYLSKIRTFFSSFLQWVEETYNYPNRLREIKKPRKQQIDRQMSFWNREEFERFISVVDDPMWHTFFTLLFYTGRRKGEVLALRPEDVKKTAITFSKSITRKTQTKEAYAVVPTKAGKSQTVPVCPVVINELKTYTPQSPFFFGGDRPLAENTVTRTFRRYCGMAGLEPIRIHDLRHSFVSMLIHMGTNFMVIADLIGDNVEQVTKTYGHLYEEDKNKVLSRIV